MAARVLTKPLSWTVPLKVSTLISVDFNDGSSRIAAFTLVVMTESSKYSPVPSWLGVAAHPSMEASRMAQTNAMNLLDDLMAKFLTENRFASHRASAASAAPCPCRYLHARVR